MKKCFNCKNEYVQILRNGYCDTCFKLINTVEGIKSRSKIPVSLQWWIDGFGDRAADLYIEAVKQRLQLMKDLHAKQTITAHDLEMRFAQVAKLAVKKPFPKRNDTIASNLNDKERLFVYQMLTEILISKKPNYLSHVVKNLV